MEKLLIDIDGVIVSYDFPKIVKSCFGVDLSSKAIFAYDLADVLGVAPFLINNMFKEQVYGAPQFNEGALKALNKLHDEYELVIFTNRLKYMTELELVSWMSKNQIPFRGISKDGSGEYFAHIDDSPAKLASTNSMFKLLFNQPWNEKCLDIKDQFLRIYSWKDIDRFLRR
jgi:5'(3')-deoxyribonucleotidase